MGLTIFDGPVTFGVGHLKSLIEVIELFIEEVRKSVSIKGGLWHLFILILLIFINFKQPLILFRKKSI